MICRVKCHMQLAAIHIFVMCRVDFHTQLADKANNFNSDDVKQLLQAVYDIMAPEGERYCWESEDFACASPLTQRPPWHRSWIILLPLLQGRDGQNCAQRLKGALSAQHSLSACTRRSWCCSPLQRPSSSSSRTASRTRAC